MGLVPTILKSRVQTSMGKVAIPGGDLLDDLLDDLLTPCAGTLRTIAFNIQLSKPKVI